MSTTFKPRRTSFEGGFHMICRIFATASMALLLAACASTGTTEPTIQNRAQARWDALLAADYDTAYGYFSPGYRSSHSRVDFEIFVRSRQVRWTSAKVEGSTCETDVCTVEVKVGYKVGKPVPGVPVWEGAEPMTERWVRTEGQWWYLPNN